MELKNFLARRNMLKPSNLNKHCENNERAFKANDSDHCFFLTFIAS